MRRLLFCVIVLVLGLANPRPFNFAQSPPTPKLTVDVAANRHPINPDIYGIASYGLDPQFAEQIRVPNVRWGGDTTTRYNWLVDSSNMGFDWYFLGGCSNNSLPGFPPCDQTNEVPGYSVDQMISTYAAAGARPLVTIPIIPYVNRSHVSSCSFPLSTYGPQQKVDPQDHPGGETCGNSLSLVGGDQIVDNDIYANHIDNSVSLQQGWIQHLVTTFGTAANGGVPYYQLDNEPSGWGNTHRDVMPTGANYPQIVSLGQTYAAMIKSTDPSAQVFGPTDYSGNGWIGNPGQQNNLYAGQYYLQQMAAYEQQNGQRILDYFDEHYYAASTDDASELASTRTLWDPTYNASGSSTFNAPMQLIPRFRSWIQQYYPGTKLAISEYGFSSGRDPLIDGLTQADVLGIFGREEVDFANIWTLPMPPAPVFCVFRLFRNYDGQGGQYGDTWVESDSSDQSTLSIYGAQRTSDRALTILVINKTAQPISTTLSLANLSADTAAVFSYSNADLTQILPSGEVTLSSNLIEYTYPAYSATLFVISPTEPVPATQTSLSASATGLREGGAVTFTAGVSLSNGAPVAEGNVAFLNGQTVLGTRPLVGGMASLVTSELSSGTHAITAVYSGEVNYAASSSAPLDVVVAPLPDYAFALSNSILSVAPGKTSGLNLVITSQDGFSASVTFSCVGLPPGAACAFDPSNVKVQGGSALTATLSVSVSGSMTTVQPVPSNPRARPSVLSMLLVLGAVLGFAGVRRSTHGKRFTRVCAVALCCVCLAGCAFWGSSHNTQLAAGNPTAYVVTVMAAGSNCPQHSQEFILSVVH